MELKLDQVYFGFKLLNEKDIPELKSKGKTFIHEKSGAKLIYLENDDDNKVFSIAFRTPPKDSTGVAHILEHSVLCGSRKFPVKEPFVELIKGSLNTFLNAFTFPDKTMYPVASRNNKDFNNLMDVYLDAVFYPNIYKYPEIMMQEGWHYELDNAQGELTYKGVVYNEMKGAFASPESILFRKIQQSLFPNTSYGVESGGDPDVIPELTQQGFLDFHKRYYHPSNSFIILYGKMDILEKLKFIDDNYLKDFNKMKVDSKIPFEKAFTKQNRMEVSYPISSSEKEIDKTFLSLNYVIGEENNSELELAFDILEYILLETPSSPLKKALIKENLGKDVFGSYESDVLQPFFSIVVKNSNESEEERFKKVVKATLSNLIKNGIDKKLIESAINVKEFELREADFNSFPKGLVYSMKCLGSWLYDEEPFIKLQYEEYLKNIKQSLKNNYFEKIIEKYILNNNHSSVVVVKPEKGLAEKKTQQLKEKLEKYKNTLSQKQIEELINQTKNLKIRQSERDTAEQLEKIPLLSIEDIDKNTEKLPLIENRKDDIKILEHDIFTNKIIYNSLYFKSSTIEEKLIPYIALLSGILGKVSTNKYNYEDLSNEINIATGGIRYNAEVFSESTKDEVFYPYFTIKMKYLDDKVEKSLELVSEIIKNSKFDDEERLKEIIEEIKSRLEMIMFDKGHIVVASRATSYCSQVGRYNEYLTGISFYKFISDIILNFHDNFETLKENLYKVSNSIFNKNNIMVSITAEKAHIKKVEDSINLVYKDLNCDKLTENNYEFQLKPYNEGLMTSSKVQYVAKASNFSKFGIDYSGSMQVLRAIVNYDYLWNKVRVQGGAYGCFSGFKRNGNVFITSYRDPNLNTTLDVYNHIYEYLQNFKANNREMTKYIIGTISDFDMPLSAQMKGERADEYYIRHITFEDLQKERNEVLETSENTIKDFAPLMENFMKESNICVLGNEDKIKENEKLFKELITVFE